MTASQFILPTVNKSPGGCIVSLASGSGTGGQATPTDQQMCVEGVKSINDCGNHLWNGLTKENRDLRLPDMNAICTFVYLLFSLVNVSFFLSPQRRGPLETYKFLSVERLTGEEWEFCRSWNKYSFVSYVFNCVKEINDLNDVI